MQVKAERYIKKLLETVIFLLLLILKRRRTYMLKLLIKCAEILAAGDKAYVRK